MYTYNGRLSFILTLKKMVCSRPQKVAQHYVKHILHNEQHNDGVQKDQCHAQKERPDSCFRLLCEIEIKRTSGRHIIIIGIHLVGNHYSDSSERVVKEITCN